MSYPTDPALIEQLCRNIAVQTASNAITLQCMDPGADADLTAAVADAPDLIRQAGHDMDILFPVDQRPELADVAPPDKGPVTQTWTHQLPFMQQTVLLTAVRGPDGVDKYAPVKYLLRWYRRCILVSSLDGCILHDPFSDHGGSFMGPSFQRPANHPDMTWQYAMDSVLSDYLRTVDSIPHHFHLHLMHAFEIVSYKHPDPAKRAWFHRAYVRLVHDMHLWPETEEQLNQRLGDTREGWLARADAATVA